MGSCDVRMGKQPVHCHGPTSSLHEHPCTHVVRQYSFFSFPRTGGISVQHDPRVSHLARFATPYVSPSSTTRPKIVMSYSICGISCSCCERPCMSSSSPGSSRPSVTMPVRGPTEPQVLMAGRGGHYGNRLDYTLPIIRPPACDLGQEIDLQSNR